MLFRNPFYERGSELAKLGRLDEEIEVYSEWVRRSPDVASGHFRLGLAYWQRGWRAKAILEHTEAIRLDSSEPKFYHNLGCLYLETRNKAKAVEALKRALSLDPHASETRLILGHALRRISRLTMRCTSIVC